MGDVTSNGEFESSLFAPDDQSRHGEGGLRTKDFEKASSSSNPLVSVITVVYNHDECLEQTIQSVLDQTYDYVEYIIIDGGSQDGSIDIIREYEDRLDYWISEDDRGPYDAMNKGVKLSRGDLVGILHAGSKYRSRTCEQAVEIHKSKDDLGIIAGSAIRPENRDEIRSERDPIGPKNPSVLHETVFVPLGIYKQVGLYDLSYDISADYDFIARVTSKHGFPVYYTDDIFVVYLEDWGISGRLENQTNKAMDHFRVRKQHVGLLFALTFLIIRTGKIAKMYVANHDLWE